MKRTLSTLLATAIMASLCACGGTDGAGSSSSGTQSTPLYASDIGSIEAPENVVIETDGTVTVSGQVKKSGGGYILELDSVTTFIINGTTYTDLTQLALQSSTADLADLEGLTVVVSGNLAPGGGAMSLTDTVVENVIE